MKISQHIFLLSLLLTALIEGSGQQTTPAPAPPGGQPAAGAEQGKPPFSYQCNRPILRSYLMKGRDKSSATEKFLLCPSVKDNCCNKIDQQKIYHIVNDILPGKYLEYRTKVSQALSKLQKLHKKINRAEFMFTGSFAKRKFCMEQNRMVKNYEYKQFFAQIEEKLTLMLSANLEHYQAFYCILCDGKNHQFMQIQGEEQKLIIDNAFCKDYILQREDGIRLMNIELIEYMRMLQNLVDCIHYTKSYNLVFFDESKITFAAETHKCLANLDSDQFAGSCMPLCQQIAFNEVIPMAEGDFVFLMNAVNLFEKFFEYQETGKFISMKLRLFFKKFEIPKTMTTKMEQQFKDEVQAKLAIQNGLQNAGQSAGGPGGAGGLSLSGDPSKQNQQPALSPQVLFAMNNPSMDPSSPYDPRIFETPMDDKKKDQTNDPNNPQSGQSAQRKLAMTENHDPALDAFLQNDYTTEMNRRRSNQQYGQRLYSEFYPSAEDDAQKDEPAPQQANPLPAYHLRNGRKLQAISAPGNSQPPNTSGAPANPMKKKKTARLVFDKDLYKFYDEITIGKSEKGEDYIYKIQTRRYNLARFKKSFVDNSGISLMAYSDMRFNMPKSIFYKMLFSYRKPDIPDPELQFMLGDFTKEFWRTSRKALKLVFEVKPANFDFKMLNARR